MVASAGDGHRHGGCNRPSRHRLSGAAGVADTKGASGTSTPSSVQSTGFGAKAACEAAHLVALPNKHNVEKNKSRKRFAEVIEQLDGPVCHEFALPIATASSASGCDENRGGMREIWIPLLGGLRVRLRLAGFVGVIHLLDAQGFGETFLWQEPSTAK